MAAAKPSLDLLTTLTDTHVLQALLDAPRLTRAELASWTGLSKPTVSAGVRRLVATGLVVDTGERTTARGGVGSYYALSRTVGHALVVGIAPEGVVAQVVDPHGAVLADVTKAIGRPASVPRAVTAAVKTALKEADGRGPTLVTTISAADPVDRATGRLVQLPDAPFLVGALSPVDLLSPLVAGPVHVDNDVNWAARAERAARTGEPAASARDGRAWDDFAYLHLGTGLGCAVVADGTVVRGRSGLAGEVAHLVTAGPKDRAMPFTEVFRLLRLRRPDSTEIDVDEVVRRLDRADATLERLAAAVGGVVSAVVALADPATVVVGGTWGRHPRLLEAVSARLAAGSRPVAVEPATQVDAPLTGARQHALATLRETVASGRG